jgi:hypothetical protein
MLRISADQMRVIEKAARESFLQRVADFLREYFAETRETPVPILLKEIRQQAAAAYGYGLTTEQEMVVYIITGKHIGTDPSRLTTVNSYLSSSRTTAEKMTFLKALMLAAHDHERPLVV